MESIKDLVIKIIFGSIIGLMSGVVIAAFLFSLEQVTNFRIANSPIVFALPVAGLAIGFTYDKWGSHAIKGNNLILNAIHDHEEPIPKRMAPMVFLATSIAHLFGASVGREGAAVQIGAVLASVTASIAKTGKQNKKILIMAGVAGGFSAAFGTPLAGMIFALEVSHLRKFHISALPAVLPAAFTGDYISRLFINHGSFPQLKIPPINFLLLIKLLALSLIVAVFCVIFIEIVHFIKKLAANYFKSHTTRMFLGGVATVLLWVAGGSSLYLGLGSPTIAKALMSTDIPWNAFLMKLAFTSIALGSGFIGGEVTPLFFMGSTLGNVAGKLLKLTPQFSAGLGLAALLGAAANAPLALSVLAAELFGYRIFPFALFVCFLSTVLSDQKRGIYLTQRIFHHGKNDWLTLEEIREIRDEF